MSKRNVLAILFVMLATGAIWGHYTAIGASRTVPPHDLVVKGTYSIAGNWPYLVHDEAGWHLQWRGLLIGTALSAVVMFIARKIAGRNDRQAAR